MNWHPREPIGELIGCTACKACGDRCVQTLIKPVLDTLCTYEHILPAIVYGPWVLFLLDVLIEDGFSFSVEYTRRDDVGLDVSSLTLEVEDFIFNLFDDLVFGNWASLLVIKLCIWQKLISFPNLFWNFDDFFLWRRLRFFLFRTLFFLFLL